MKKCFKNHIRFIVVLLVFTILVIGCFIAYNSIFVNNQSKYGDRLDGIDSVKITSDKKSIIQENVESLKITKSYKIRISGKTINTIAVVNDDIDTNKAKEIGGKVLEKLSDEEKKFYDIQIFISKEKEDEKFPIVGYKHHAKDNITWTKDR